MNSFIQKMYNNLIDIIIKDIPEEYLDIIKKKYFNYLNNIYSKEKSDKKVDVIIEFEKKQWSNLNTNSKLFLFITDDYYERICKLSDEALSFAWKKLIDNNNQLSEKEADNKIKDLKEALFRVKDFNKDSAQRLVSESILDYQYASRDTKYISLRIGHIMMRRKSTKN